MTSYLKINTQINIFFLKKISKTFYKKGKILSDPLNLVVGVTSLGKILQGLPWIFEISEQILVGHKLSGRSFWSRFLSINNFVNPLTHKKIWQNKLRLLFTMWRDESRRYLKKMYKYNLPYIVSIFKVAILCKYS